MRLVHYAFVTAVVARRSARMFSWSLVCLAAGLSGCRHQQLREAFLIEAFSAETRLLEDKLYELAYRVDELESRLDQLEQPAGSTPPSSRRPLEKPSPRTPSAEGIPDLTPPKVEPGRPTTPEELRQSSSGRSQHATLVDTSAEGTYTEIAQLPSPQDKNIVALHIDERSGVADWDGKPGADGVRLIVRPVNRAGELVVEDGELIAVLLDARARSHVGRWEFDRLTLQRAVRDVPGGPAVVVRLPWKLPPAHAELHLFVRWQTSDGRRWEANRPLSLSLATDKVQGSWSPRTAGRSSSGPPADVYR